MNEGTRKTEKQRGLALDGRKKMSGLCACRYVSYIFVSVSVSL